MPIDPKLLEILCCPITRAALQQIDAVMLEKVNARIQDGTLRYKDNTVVDAALSEGLITHDGKMLYRIDDDIPIMLPEKAIPLQAE